MIGSEAAVAIATTTIACSACTEPTAQIEVQTAQPDAAAASIWAGAGSGMPQRYGRGPSGTSRALGMRLTDGARRAHDETRTSGWIMLPCPRS